MNEELVVIWDGAHRGINADLLQPLAEVPLPFDAGRPQRDVRRTGIGDAVLKALKAIPDQTPHEVAARLDVPVVAVQNALYGLEKRGKVETSEQFAGFDSIVLKPRYRRVVRAVES